TPMRRGDYLLSLMIARLVFLALEVVVIVAFGWLVFGVAMRGSWPGFVAVSGLMNVVMMPMWLMSGSFFSADRFPGFLQPFIHALPLTAANEAYRALMNEGATFLQVAPQLGVLLA